MLIIDGYRVIRNGLRRVFDLDHRFAIVGEAATVDEAMCMAARKWPDVVILDLRLPDGSGLDVIRAIRDTHPGTAIIVLTLWAGDALLERAVELGADSVLHKTATADEIVAAAWRAVHGIAGVVPSSLAEVDRTPRRSPWLSLPLAS
jgi:DNA-binding NarL/FixJ family response regulator